MTPEQLDRARAEEAKRLWREQGAPLSGSHVPIEIAARLAREGWTPPAPISPRLRAAREWLKVNMGLDQGFLDSDIYDDCDSSRAFLAGAAWAVKKAEPLVEYLNDAASSLNGGRADANLQTYRQEIGDE